MLDCDPAMEDEFAQVVDLAWLTWPEVLNVGDCTTPCSSPRPQPARHLD